MNDVKRGYSVRRCSKFLISCVILVLILNYYSIDKVEASQEDEVIWVKTENSSLSSCTASGVAADSSGIYVVGAYISLTSFSSLMNPYKWLIEKRSLADGRLVWNRTSAGASASVRIAVDSSGIYVVGSYVSSTSGYQWLVEKRSLADGKLMWNQTSNLNISGNPSAIAVSDSGIYIVGEDTYQGGAHPTSMWRIEKRSLSDGSLIWVQTNDLSLEYADYATGVAVDSSGIYVVGTDFSSPSTSHVYRWRIEKRSLVDGAIIWVKTSSLSGNNDGANNVAVDASGIYVVGYDSLPGQSNAEWRIEKRSLSDGTSIWSQTSNPSGSYDGASDIVIDASAIYVVGYDSTSGVGTDRVEKRSLTDGELIWIQTSTDRKIARDVAIDASGIYLVGPAWRIVKRSTSAGTIPLPFYLQTWFLGGIVAVAIVLGVSIFIFRRARANRSSLQSMRPPPKKLEPSPLTKVAPTLHCPKCGTELPVHAEFCSECGTKLPPHHPMMRPARHLFNASIITVLIAIILSLYIYSDQYLLQQGTLLVVPIISAIIGICVYLGLLRRRELSIGGRESVVFGLMTTAIFASVWPVLMIIAFSGRYSYQLPFGFLLFLATYCAGYTLGAFINGFALKKIRPISEKSESPPPLSKLPQPTRQLRTDEKVLWIGKPAKISFIISNGKPILAAMGILSSLFPVILGLRTLIGQPIGPMIPFLVIVGLQSVALGYSFVFLLRKFLIFNKTEYFITNQRLIVQTSDLPEAKSVELERVQKAYVKTSPADGLFGTGTLIIQAEDDAPEGTALTSLKEPNEVRKLLLETVVKDEKGSQLMPLPEKLEPSPPVSSTPPKEEAESNERPQRGIFGMMRDAKNRLADFYKEQMDVWFGTTELLDAVCERLRGIGVSVTLLERENLVPILTPNYGPTLGCFAIEGRNIDLVHVGCLSKSRGGGEDGPPDYTTNVFLLSYVVRVSRDVSESELEADFEPIVRRTGTVVKEVEVAGFQWTGRGLAEVLSRDSDLSRMMLSLGLERLEIKVDRRRGPDPFHPKAKRDWGAVIITPMSPLVNRALAKGGLRDFSNVGREDLPTLEAFEAYERIAQHIRNVTSTAKRRR